jgi:branched-chain amino acid transport system permease protein
MANFLMTALTMSMIYALLALSLNFQYGLSGLLNFGQGAFFVVGAGTVAFARMHDLPTVVGVIGGPVLAGLLGAVLAAPARRMAPAYWALLTLGAAEFLNTVLAGENGLVGGPQGTSGIPSLASDGTLLAGLVVLVAGVAYLFDRIRVSRFGRTVRAMREDPLLPATFGVSVGWYQVTVVAAGAVVASLAGVAYAHYLGYMSPTIFGIDDTFNVWAMMVIGGLANPYGSVAGAILIETLYVGSRLMPRWGFMSTQGWAIASLVVVGGGLVVFIRYFRRGLVPERKVAFDVAR